VLGPILKKQKKIVECAPILKCDVGRNKAVKAKITKGDEKIHPQIFFIKGAHFTRPEF